MPKRDLSPHVLQQEEANTTSTPAPAANKKARTSAPETLEGPRSAPETLTTEALTDLSFKLQTHHGAAAKKSIEMVDPLPKTVDEAGATEVDAERLTKLQHHPAFDALLKHHGRWLETTDVHTTVLGLAPNKVTYVNLKVITPGGTEFKINVRLGDCELKGSSVRRGLFKTCRVATLRRYASLGADPSRGTYGLITLTKQGSDLTEIGPDGFSIVEVSS
jgi:hypothetical protein